MRSEKKDLKSERGQSLTELALMMGFLLILLAGVVDIGRAFFTYIELRDAAQEAALIASYATIHCADLDDRVKTSTSNLESLIDGGTVTISCDLDPYCLVAGTNFTITVDYVDFPLAMPFIGTLLNSQTVDISASIIDTVITNDPVICGP